MLLFDYIAIAWMLVGFIGGLIIAKLADGDISLGDFAVCCTLYVAGGPIAIGIGLFYLRKIRKVYKKYGIKV